MFGIDLDDGKMVIGDKEYEIDKSNCMVMEGNGELKILCGEEKEKFNPLI